MKKIFSFLIALLLIGIYGLYTILAVRPSDSAPIILTETEEIPYVHAEESADYSTLSRLFDHPFPLLPRAAFIGSIRTTRYDDRNARVLVLQYSQLTLTCVQPASAAPMLLRDGLIVKSLWSDQQRRYSILSMPVVYAENGSARCIYFSDESAAYSLYTPSLPLNEFLAAAGSLKWNNAQ